MTIGKERDTKAKKKKVLSEKKTKKKQFNPIIWKANNTYAWKKINFSSFVLLSYNEFSFIKASKTNKQDEKSKRKRKLQT